MTKGGKMKKWIGLMVGGIAAGQLAVAAPPCKTPFGNGFCYRPLPLDVCTMELMPEEDECIIIYKPGSSQGTIKLVKKSELKAKAQLPKKPGVDIKRSLDNATFPDPKRVGHDKGPLKTQSENATFPKRATE
jgi:hypothetical protein